MSTDYANLKVPELKKLLNERGLAQSGNKADLITRLQENDKEKAPAAPAAAAAANVTKGTRIPVFPHSMAASATWPTAMFRWN